MVESGGFIDLGHGQLHFNRQGQQVAMGQAAVAVLDLVQVLHQQVAGAGFIPQQLADVRQRLVGRNPPLNTTSFAACAFHWPVKKQEGKQAPPRGSSFPAWRLCDAIIIHDGKTGNSKLRRGKSSLLQAMRGLGPAPRPAANGGGGWFKSRVGGSLGAARIFVVVRQRCVSARNVSRQRYVSL